MFTSSKGECFVENDKTSKVKKTKKFIECIIIKLCEKQIPTGNRNTQLLFITGVSTNTCFVYQTKMHC